MSSRLVAGSGIVWLTPIVAVTANCSSDYRDLCRDNGMQGFLSKPVQSGELVKTVEKHLAACSNGAA